MQKTHLSFPEKATHIGLIVLPAILICIVFRHVLADTLEIILGASIIAFLMEPFCTLLEKKFPREVSALLALMIAAAALLLIGWFLFPSLIRQTNSLLQSLPQIVQESKQLLQRGSRWFEKHIGDVPSFLTSLAPLSDSPLPAIASQTISFAGNIADLFYRFSLMIVLGYFFLCERAKILMRLELLIPLRIRKSAVRTGKAVLRELRLYLRGQAMIALVVGALAAFGLWCIALPSPLALGAIVGILNMIPYFGPIIGGIPAVLIAFGAGWQTALLTVAVLWLVQQLDGTFISPRIMGSVLGISPMTVLLAIFIGSSLSGIVGMLIALPVVMCIRTIFRVFVQTHENV